MALNREELLAYLENNAEIKGDCDVLETDCRNIIFLLDNCEITIPENNRFFVDVNCSEIPNHICRRRMRNYDSEIAENGLSAGQETLAFTGNYDFSHTTTEWKSVISLGISGLRKRISEYAKKNKDDKKKQRFYNEISKVYDLIHSQDDIYDSYIKEQVMKIKEEHERQKQININEKEQDDLEK